MLEDVFDNSAGQPFSERLLVCKLGLGTGRTNWRPRDEPANRLRVDKTGGIRLTPTLKAGRDVVGDGRGCEVKAMLETQTGDTLEIQRLMQYAF